MPPKLTKIIALYLNLVIGITRAEVRTLRVMVQTITRADAARWADANWIMAQVLMPLAALSGKLDIEEAKEYDITFQRELRRVAKCMAEGKPLRKR